MGRRFVQIGLGVALGLLVAILIVLPGPARDQAGDDPHILPGPWEVPSTTLLDPQERPVELPGSFDGVTAVFFGYTNCPDVCPITLAELGRVAEALGPESARRFRIVFVSVDPERDTPERVGRYVQGFHPAVVGLTADSPEALEPTLSAWGVHAGRAEGAGAGAEPAGAPDAPETESAHAHAPSGDASSGSYLVDHSARTFLLDASGRVVGSFPHSTRADAMRPTVETLLARDGRGR